MTKRFWIILISGLVTLSACAKPPQQKLNAAEYMVAQAYSVEAEKYAPTEYHAAHDALDAAQKDLLKRRYSEAEESLDFAVEHARRAISLSIETKQKIAEEEAHRKELEAQQAAALKRAAKEAIKVKSKSQDIKSKANSPPPPPPPPPATTYTVRNGDNLWIISNRNVVYGDGFLWPLLYQANRDQIKDPQQIYPGQVLNIRRDLTEQEKEEARLKARESDVFPIPEEFRPLRQ